MNIINGVRRSGRTTDALKFAAANNNAFIVTSKEKKQLANDIAKSLGLEVEVFTAEEYSGTKRMTIDDANEIDLNNLQEALNLLSHCDCIVSLDEHPITLGEYLTEQEEKKTQCTGCTMVNGVCTKPTGEVCTQEECAEAGCATE